MYLYLHLDGILASEGVNNIMSRIGVFVDVSSCYYNINKKWPGRKLNYEAFLYKAKEQGSELARVIAYGTQIEDGARKFISCLNLLGFEPKYKTVERNQWYSWDVGMTVDMVRNHEKLDTIIIGNSNRHMVPIVEYLQEKGCKTIIIACGIPRELRECCFKWFEITEDMLEEAKEEVTI